MSLSELARHRAVVPSRIHKLWSSGVLPRNADGRFDVETCDRILDERAELVLPTVREANEAIKKRLRAKRDPVAVAQHHARRALDALKREAWVEFCAEIAAVRAAWQSMTEADGERLELPVQVWDALCGFPGPWSAHTKYQPPDSK